MPATTHSHMVHEHEIATMNDGSMKLDRRFEETGERAAMDGKKMEALLKEKDALKRREAESEIGKTL